MGINSLTIRLHLELQEISRLQTGHDDIYMGHNSNYSASIIACLSTTSVSESTSILTDNIDQSKHISKLSQFKDLSKLIYSFCRFLF